MRKVYLVLFIMCCAATSLLAQDAQTIFGTVTDPSGAAVPGAKVDAILIERSTTRTTTTGPAGEYVFGLLPIGTYEIRVESTGFAPFQRTPITLDANQNVRVDAPLALKGTAQSVTVHSDVAPVDTRSGTMGALIDEQRVMDLPMNGRTIFELVALLPGATELNAPQVFSGDRTGPYVSLSGARPTTTLNLFDDQNYSNHFRNTGLEYPPPDAVQEVQVLTSNFSTEYGRDLGGIISVVSKSGSNQVHGDLYEFVRNNDFNAHNFFILTRPKLIQNQFGGTAGGPIIKNKLFTFGSYEALRLRKGCNQGLVGSVTATAFSFPLTALERAGTFTTPIIDPQTGMDFPQASPGVYQIPNNRLDPTAQAFFTKNLLPLPNGPGGILIQPFPEPNDVDEGLMRVDYNVTSNHLLTARYNNNNVQQTTFGGQVPLYQPQAQLMRTQAVTAADTWTINPHLVNEFRLAYMRAAVTVATSATTTLGDLGANLAVYGGIPQPSTISISGRVTLGSNGGPWDKYWNQDRQLKDHLIWTKGNHTIKTGFEYLNLRYDVIGPYNCAGSFSFTGAITGNPAADFVLGLPESLTIDSTINPDIQRTSDFDGYAQDDWRVSRRLTVSGGLRYELQLPWSNPYNHMSYFIPGEQSQVYTNAPTGMIFPGDKNFPWRGVPMRWNDVGPRFGFAYDVFGDGRTSIRGGYGIFHDQFDATAAYAGGQPFSYGYSYTAPYSLTNPLYGQAPPPTVINLTPPVVFSGVLSPGFMTRNVRTPYVESVNLSIQREVARNTVVEISYMGHFGHHLLMWYEINPAWYVPGASTLGNENSRRTNYPGFGDMTLVDTAGLSNYHGLYVQVTKRYSRNFSIQGVYAYSKAISQVDDASPNFTIPQPFNLRTQMGLSGYNATHNGSLSWIYNLPKLSQQPAALRAIAGGWQWNGLYTAMTGLPQNPLNGSDVALTGTSSQRPNLVGQRRQPGKQTHAEEKAAWFNPAAFAKPATGTYGNAARDVVVGPPLSSVNASLFKNIPIHMRENMNLQIRAEFFNLFNFVNFNAPTMTLGSSMGTITSAGDPRILQFAVKLLF